MLVSDEGIVSYETEVKYHSSDHGEMTGSGFDKIITFTGIKPGETTVVVEERSPIADNLDHKYTVTVDDELNVQIEQLSVKDINEDAGESMILMIDGIKTGYGDIVLYSGNQIVVFYGSNSWAYTRLGHIDMTQEELTELLGNGDVEITLE